MRIAAYCRVSTDTADQLNSLETQKQFFLDYTEKNGHQLVRLYADEGISGTKIKKRKEFQRLMEDAKGGLFDMVVVKDISRFARNTVDLLQSTRTLKALGIETLFLTANMTTLSNSEFVLTVFGALAQEESANTSKRIKFGKQINAEKGRVPNLVYGYDKTAGDYFHLSINEEEAAVIRRIFHWYTEEGYGSSKIAAMLNEQGVRTKRGCAWSQNGICRLLSNEIYTGVIINGKQEVSDFLTGIRTDREQSSWLVKERPELQMIPPEQFQKAQQLLKTRGQALPLQRQRHSNQHLFSTLIKCKECGWSYRRMVRSYQNTYIRWVCSSHNGKGADSCPNTVSLDEGALQSALEEYFLGLLTPEDQLYKWALREMQKRYQAERRDGSTEKALKAKRSKLEHSRKKYMDLYAEDFISREELKEKLTKLRMELEHVEEALALATNEQEQGEGLAQCIRQCFSKLQDIVAMDGMSNAQLRQLIERIEVSKDGSVDIYLASFEDVHRLETVPFRHIGT